MSTQVSTSHTNVNARARAPLKVPKRPPMNHVTHAIQKFLPIVVVFLLGMVAYSYIRPVTTVYPPYSPPNVGQDMDASRYGELGEFARNTINKRAEMFEEMKRKSEGYHDAKTGDWRVWNNKKAAELKERLERARTQGVDEVSTLASELRWKSGLDHPIMDDPHTVEAAEWWKDHGEKLVDDAREFSGAAQDFAYDAIYAWKHRAAQLKAAAKNKLEDLKDDVETGKEKAEQVIDNLKEKGEALEQGAKEVVHSTLGKSVEELSKRLEGLKEGILRTAFDDKQSTRNLVPHRLDNNTMASKLSAFIERVKSGLVQDEEVRRALSMKAEWDKVDFEHKVDGIVQQICLLGDDVVDAVVKRLSSEQSQGTCTSHPVCPAA